MKITGIYLAAGNSSRFGSNKLNQILQDRPIGAHALSTALKSDLQKVIVVRNESDSYWLAPFLKDEKCKLVTCRKTQIGQAYSIHSGLRYAEKHGADAIMVILADQPFITVNMMNTLIETYKKQRDVSFIASSHNGITCPPILFSSLMFPDLYALNGDHGARYLLTEKETEGIFLNFSYEEAFYDIDTVHDYESILRKGLP